MSGTRTACARPTRLLERFKALEAFNAHDQEMVIQLIDAMIVKQRVESAIQPVGKALSG